MHARVARKIAKKIIKDGAHPAHHDWIIGPRNPEVRFNQPNRHDSSEPFDHIDSSLRTGSLDQRPCAFGDELSYALKVSGTHDLVQGTGFAFVLRRPIHAKKKWTINGGEMGLV